MDVAPRSTTIRFGQFELYLGNGKLSKLGRKIRLQSQSFQIFTSLLDRSPHGACGHFVRPAGTHLGSRSKLHLPPIFTGFPGSCGAVPRTAPAS